MQIGGALPNSILNKFGKLTGTLKSKIPQIDIGILFNDPTKLQRQHKSFGKQSNRQRQTTNNWRKRETIDFFRISVKENLFQSVKNVTKLASRFLVKQGEIKAME